MLVLNLVKLETSINGRCSGSSLSRRSSARQRHHKAGISDGIIIIITFITRKLVLNHKCVWQILQTEQVCFQFPAKNSNILDRSQSGSEVVPQVWPKNGERARFAVRRRLRDEQSQVLPIRQRGYRYTLIDEIRWRETEQHTLVD